MGELTVDGQPLDDERVGSGEETWYQLTVRFEDGAGVSRTDERDLDVDGRGAVTADVVEEALEAWRDDRDDVDAITAFTVVEADLVRRGGDADATGADRSMSASVRPPRRDLPFAAGDVIAYHVDGPESSVYGYTKEAVVVETPPIHRQHKEPIEGKVEVETEVGTKLIPLKWVVDPAAEAGDDDTVRTT